MCLCRLRRIIFMDRGLQALILIDRQHRALVVKHEFAHVLRAGIIHDLPVAQTAQVLVEKGTEVVLLQVGRNEHIVQIAVQQEYFIQLGAFKY